MKKMRFFFSAATIAIASLAAGQQSLQPQIRSRLGDSFYLAEDWENAKLAYEAASRTDTLSALQWMRLGFANYNLGHYDEALGNYDRSIQQRPPAQLMAPLYSRMARVFAVQNKKDEAVSYLEKAVNAGYFNFSEMDTLQEFSQLRQQGRFSALRNKAYSIAFPCAVDPRAREFDFWVGEWDAYITGSTVLAGHSVIQVASGGCMILENWTSAKAPFNGKSMNFIDQKTGKWQQVWVGSGGGGANVFVNGEYHDSAMRFQFEQTDTNGHKLTGRFTFFNQGPNQVRQLNETSADGGKTWQTVYDFTYIRKKD
jgi:hypothetical protein